MTVPVTPGFYIADAALDTAAGLQAGGSSTKFATTDEIHDAIVAMAGSGFTICSQAEAEAGTENTKGMTPLRTAQAIAALAPGGGGGGVAFSVTSQSANYTAAVDEIVRCNATGGAFTVTLPTGSNGKIVIAQKTDSSSNAVTVGSTAVHTQGETVWMVHDGSAWVELDRRIPKKVFSYTPAWTAATTNPSLGNGVLTGQWWRDGRFMVIAFDLIMGTTTTFGSGEWYLGIPTGYTIDTNVITLGQGNTPLGTISATDYGTALHVANGIFHGTDKFKMVSQGGTSYWGSTVPFTWAANGFDRLCGRVSVPIVGWNG